jgi:hypothetical protein
MDGLVGARAKLRNLTSGSIAIMCSASHEGVPVKLFLHMRLLPV